MGVNGLSQAEAKLLLKALPALGPNPSDVPVKSPSTLSSVRYKIFIIFATYLAIYYRNTLFFFLNNFNVITIINTYSIINITTLLYLRERLFSIKLVGSLKFF